MVEQEVPWRVWTVPNALSLLRLVGIPVYLWLLLSHHDVWAFWVLVISSFTDWADGKIARTYNLTSRVGQLLDPLADRLYIIATIVGLALRSIIPWWLVVVLLAREVFVFSFGPALRAHRLPIPAVHFSGKAATLCLVVGFPLVLLGATDLPIATVANWIGWAFVWWGTALYWFAGFLYAIQIRRMIAAVS